MIPKTDQDHKDTKAYSIIHFYRQLIDLVMSSSPGDVQIHVYEEIPASLENMEGERIHRNNNVGDGTSTGTSEVTSVASVTTMVSLIDNLYIDF